MCSNFREGIRGKLGGLVGLYVPAYSVPSAAAWSGLESLPV